jgi:DNA-binding XRE family transcriptional regulator
MASKEGNIKISKSRGNPWKNKLVAGRIDAELHPTKLKLGRARRLMSQEKLAQKVGISLATYGAIERARRKASATTAKKISLHLKISPKDIFRAEGKKFIAIK